MKKIILIIAVLILVINGMAYAQVGKHMLKNNSIAIKPGYHFYPSSDFLDFWGFDDRDFDGFVFEFSYERKINLHIGIEFTVGFFTSEVNYTNVLFSGDSSTTDINNWYISQSLKYHLPINDNFSFYVGGGGDIYRTKGDYEYFFSGVTYKVNESFKTFGLHGLAGLDWYLIKKPAEAGNYDMPLSLFVEYKYSWVEIENADEVVINDINSVLGTSFPNHEADVGGHTLLAGVRWHF